MRGDGPSLTFAKIEALVAERNVAGMDSRACRGTYYLCAKQTGSKGKEIKRLWPKLHNRLTTGVETPRYAEWMGFARFVCSEWSFKSKRKREASDSPRSSKRVKVADPDRRAQNGRSYRKLRALLKAPARDSIRHKRIIAPLPQALQLHNCAI